MYLDPLVTHMPIFKIMNFLCKPTYCDLVLCLIKIDCSNEVVLPEKKRAHDGTLIAGEKTIVRKIRSFAYPDLNKVLILPDTKQKTEAIKKVKRRNPLFYLMLSKPYNHHYFSPTKL